MSSQSSGPSSQTPNLLLPPVKGLQVPRGAVGSRITRHVQYQLNPNDTGIKAISNRINSEGDLMPNACTPCLKSLKNYTPDQTLGRGAKDYNELFSCVASAKWGNGGNQCGRCVGIGNAEACEPPPKVLYKDARAVIACVPEYNRVLLDNPARTFDQLSDADQLAINKAIDASKSFSEKMAGHHRSGLVPTPSKKRKAGPDSEKLEELKASSQSLTLSSTDIRHDIARLERTMKSMGSVIKETRSKVKTLNELARTSRERERWMVTALGALIRQGNAAHATSDLPDPDLRINVNPDFDIYQAAFLDEDPFDHDDDEEEEE